MEADDAPVAAAVTVTGAEATGAVVVLPEGCAAVGVGANGPAAVVPTAAPARCCDSYGFT